MEERQYNYKRKARGTDEGRKGGRKDEMKPWGVICLKKTSSKNLQMP